MKKSSILPVIVLVLFFLYIAMGAILSKIPMTSDPAWGFLVLDSMKNGSPFNYLVVPDAQNIALDKLKFMSNWSPGQFIYPLVFQSMGFSLGGSLVATNILFALIGVVGWSVFYIKVGFDRNIVILSATFIIVSKMFTHTMMVYFGGDTLLFGIAPWACLVFWHIRDLNFKHIFIIVIIIIIFSFTKLSGAIFIGALLCGCILVMRSDLKSMARASIVSGIAVAIFLAFLHFYWTSRGGTALSPSERSLAGLALVSLSYPVVGPLSSIFGLGGFLEALLLCPCRPGLPPPWLFFNIALPFAVILYAWVYRNLAKDSALRSYAQFAGICAAAYTFAFVVLYARGSTIFLEERHFRVIGLLVLPGILHAAISSRHVIFRYGIGLALLASTAFGQYIFYSRFQQNLSFTMSPRGFRDDRASLRTIEFVQSQINRSKNPLLYASSPMLLLEFDNVRRMSTLDGEDESKADLALKQYKGRVGTIYILLTKEFVNSGKSDVVLRSFVDYQPSEWKTADFGDYVLFSA